ncbi:hypothetical protein GGC64_001943 [Mycobacterium sp. OAS707]|uniref:cytochrome P450 n=1 Tax=Mycobacterium sp. OAS707 TaxID=2663822 RepID=UPI0017896B51|nr:cytochrome P450 [Mycobacterium sp. OAS707]MBE1547935.1 hypothetical protein [Mycobacterium sp. OAS707]
MGVAARVPPGPRWPKFIQAIAYLTVAGPVMKAMTKRYGSAFTMHLPVVGPTVTVTDRELAKALFAQPPDAVRGVDANLGVMLGPGSSFGLEGDKHRQHRKLLLPQFHGKRMRAYEGLIEQETLAEIANWPADQEFSVLDSTLTITLNTILRALFGAAGEELEALRKLMPPLVKVGQRMPFVPWLRHDFGPWSPWVRFKSMRKELDGIIETQIAKALADPAIEQRTDVLSALLLARYDDGTPMSRSDITDELFTLVVAGHETTATSLAWSLERLRRHPDVVARLVDEIEAGESRLLQATIYEVLRTRPVIASTARQVIAPSIALGPWVIPRGYTVSVNIYLTHLNEQLYQQAEAFDPDRFLDAAIDLYSWIPFGGGNRRCPGAAFAHMEMEVVLRTILREYELVPTSAPGERWQSKGVAFGPAHGARVVVRRRRRTAAAGGEASSAERSAPW